MALTPGRPIEGTKVDWVFVGSCTNSRLSDLREAAQIARSRQVAPGVTAWVVPGSERVKRDAEAEGLDAIFTSAGFQWRGPGCSMCVAANGERVPPGARCVSTMAEPVYGAARAAEIADVIGTMGPATRMAAVTGLLRTDDANA